MLIMQYWILSQLVKKLFCNTVRYALSALPDYLQSFLSTV